MNLTRSRILTFVELINDILDESTQLKRVWLVLCKEESKL